MAQHLSVFKIYIRSSLYKVLLLLTGMAAVESLLFAVRLSALRKDAGAQLALEAVLESSNIAWISWLFMVLITIVLCINGCERGSRQGYTLRRLSIPESAVVLWQCVCNICCYLLFWAVQTVTAFGLCRWYVVKMGIGSNQTIFLAFYRSTFLHNLLPLDETGLWVRNVLLLIAFGMASAYFSYRQRRGKFAAELIALFWGFILWCSRDLGGVIMDVFAMICCLILIAAESYRIFVQEVEHEE